MYAKVIKPLMDFIVALVAVLLLSPVFLVLLVILAIVNDGKPLFFQQRPGKNGRVFSIVKFKTMNDKKDSQGNLLPDEQRMTKAGSFIRKTSLDEIPQLLNVLKGDMSIVGPRPLLVKYLPLYTERQARRHEVRPGITGWAQVNGRNAISWEQKFELDVYYVDHISLGLDIKTLYLTVLKVIKRSDINTDGVATTIPFTGTKNDN
ncbi:lipid carrier--UDP-N-acetylgalactosaminyltransferase [Flavobacterium album]|uniref:Lipid carrier--UDP-N-acetylgalactosaminyltransferase n=1 Tax=Flavobacterium album TaxID=2175091 RepID=A0A2S1QXM2_9FLAO|nr:sugar transferase [Flavobacterium album]AWH85135.1 lipid carrier--UDP-N-acetylgalactosaminyltransferase [Flavobacterium album]